jgi:ADP-heptose:LPS heptosyltransferase
VSFLKALDPLVLHLTESILGRNGKGAALSFGESLDGTRDVLLVAARELPDLLSIIPAARAIRKRFRLARVHVLAADPCAEVLEARPEIFETIRWDPDAALASRDTVALARRLAAHPFDLAIAVDSGEGRVARTLAALSGAKLRVGIHPEGSDPTLNLVVAAPLVEGYRPVQSLEFLSFLGMPRDVLAPHWEIPPVDREYAHRLLNLRRNGRDGWLLGVDPGPAQSGRRATPAKLAWMVDRIVEHRGALPILLTSSADKSYAEELRSCMKSRPLEVSQRGIRDVLSFTKCCDLFLSGNTDLFHLAVALEVPTVGLFGREEEDRWIPRDVPECRILRLRPGERVLESEFLEVVDDVRRSGVVHLPIRIALAEEKNGYDAVPAPEAEEGQDARRA